VHTLFAFELTKGCSVGCWFCGFSAEKLQGVFPYTPQNASLWRDLLQTGVDLFGPAMQCGACYWATEPADNPDYLRFVGDFRKITGVMPQTTTAVPLRDVAWTREVLRFQRESLSVPARFSILSTNILRRVHEAFSAEDLLHVELLHQHQDSVCVKAKAGRARQGRKPVMRSGDSEKFPKNRIAVHPHQTIACVSGFLINMVDRSIRLISPCRASDRWPLGYRVHAEGHFADAREFRDFIERSIEEHMPEHVAGDDIVAFRDDLAYSPLPDGFSLTNQSVTHKFTGQPFLVRLGSLIEQGEKTAGEIIGALLQEEVDILAATGAIQDLFDKGLLDEERPILQQGQEAHA
jgi:radical SAM family RiPP maturation amino acid epimerase